MDFRFGFNELDCRTLSLIYYRDDLFLLSVITVFSSFTLNVSFIHPFWRLV